MAALRGDTLAALRATYTTSSSSSVVGGGGKAGAAASMVEVDRGRCVSFAWIGTDDAYTILSPSYRCEAAKPEAKDESSIGPLIPSKLFFKTIPSATSSSSSRRPVNDPNRGLDHGVMYR